MKRFYIHTLGCPKNQVDSSSLCSAMTDGGLLETDAPEDADFILVNTCGFIEEAKEESIEHILEIIERKSPGQKAIVFGCLAQRYREELRRELPEVDAIFGVESFHEILEFIKLWGNNSVADRTLSHRERSSSYAYLKIAEGCNRRCTFCVIPSIRGALRSYPPERVLEEARRLVEEGVKEIILVAQDITSYGLDRGGFKLHQLVREMASIEGEFWIRLLYLYPSMIDDELMEVIREEDKVCPYLDIPVQHSEERILRLMGRGGSSETFKELFQRLREGIPGVVLRTTVIVGFPSETDEEFERLLDFVKEVGFDRLGVFRYSREEGTEAYRMKGHIPEEVKWERYHEVMKTQAEISYKKNLTLINRKFQVLTDGIDGDMVIARYYGQAPEIDGIVIIYGLGEGIRPGRFVDVRITDADEYDLRAEVV